MLPSYSITMQQLDIDQDSKVVRISKNNYQKLVSQGKYGDTFDSILSRILGQNIPLEKEVKTKNE
jgi:hypothetical protein